VDEITNEEVSIENRHCFVTHVMVNGSVHPAYNPSFSACFFSRNSIFLSQQISQQCFSAGLSVLYPSSENLQFSAVLCQSSRVAMQELHTIKLKKRVAYNFC
jgi:hypothetical protein